MGSAPKPLDLIASDQAVTKKERDRCICRGHDFLSNTELMCVAQSNQDAVHHVPQLLYDFVQPVQLMYIDWNTSVGSLRHLIRTVAYAAKQVNQLFDFRHIQLKDITVERHFAHKCAHVFDSE